MHRLLVERVERCRDVLGDLQVRYSYKSVINKHIPSTLGRKPALSVDHAPVSALHHSLNNTPAVANRAVEMLFRIYRAAEEREFIPEGTTRAGRSR